MSSFSSNALRVHGIRQPSSDDTTERPPSDMAFSPYSQPDSPTGDDDENASLRSQALNADGTPKRPMNAFMIFARRRRPQVSAANQMMRTGEISKILSKEWNTMPMSDKQFYLDQAKKLKENFNAKYPDYVYRRRPNNSRKKRRTDVSTRGVDAYGDPRDDSLSPHEHSPTDYHSASPIDGLAPNEQSVTLASQQYRLNPYSTSHSGSHHYHASSSESGYPYYSQSQGPSHHAHHSHRLSHHPSWSSHHDASPSSAGSNLSPVLGGSHGLHSSISYPPSHSPSIYHPDDDTGMWQGTFPRLEQPVKLAPTTAHSWGHSAAGGGGGVTSHGSSLSARRGSLQPPPLLPHALSRSESYAHARNWSESSTGTGTTSPSSSGSGSFPPFQTLTAPFYPSSGTVSPSTASSSSAASHSSYFGSSVGAAGQHGQERDGYDPNSPTYASHAQAAQAASGGSSSSASLLHPPRSYTGPTLGSTLALSPANATSASGSSVPSWSSVRTKSEGI